MSSTTALAEAPAPRPPKAMPEQEERRVLGMMRGDLREVAELIGVEAALRIAEAFKGTTIYVPALGDLRRLRRNEDLRRDHEAGMKVRDLARRYGLGTRAVYKVLGGGGVG